jgi:hypothetical protein
MMQGMSLLHNPKTNITKAEALDNENKIIKQPIKVNFIHYLT